MSLPRSGAIKENFGEVSFHYYHTAMAAMQLINTGHNVQVKVTSWDPETTPYITDGGLEGKYFLDHVEIYWGQGCITFFTYFNRFLKV